MAEEGYFLQPPFWFPLKNIGVLESRITYLAYAPGIAAARLQVLMLVVFAASFGKSAPVDRGTGGQRRNQKQARETLNRGICGGEGAVISLFLRGCIAIKTNMLLLFLSTFLLVLLSACSSFLEEMPDNVGRDTSLSLPPPMHTGNISLEEVLYTRVSQREYSEVPVSFETVAQILWAAQGKGIDGVTGASRTAPSAGATHPLGLYLMVGSVDGLEPGVYGYNYAEHTLTLTMGGDWREALASAALNQRFVAHAPASIILAADYEKTTVRYGERGIRYVHMEVGHVTQNIYLQCEALKMGAVAIGAFQDEDVKNLLKIEETPLMIVPFGK